MTKFVTIKTSKPQNRKEQLRNNVSKALWVDLAFPPMSRLSFKKLQGFTSINLKPASGGGGKI